ncbi:transcriptional regulator LytR [Oerskovia enterophila]|uniref:Transcriptional regulator LytR n=1 Tax=Oerskovia enterophila TaxID=43678 RepID=A0ABX2Y7J9_9CELL|nr:transcriptional regulator LytR [Oerskovia enterophila]
MRSVGAQQQGAGGTAGRPAAVQPTQRPRPTTPGQATRGASATTARSGRAPGSASPRPGAGSPPGARPPLDRPSSPRGGSGFRLRKGRLAAVVGVFALVLLLAWPVGLLVWANGKIQHVDALSGAPGTAGSTYLLAGSDARGGDGIAEDGTEGARTDTIMVLHKPSSGPAALISLPRDTFVDVPGKGPAKLNAAYSWGGAPLLVQTVEGLTGLTVDHYVEIGLGGVSNVVNSVGGVELCLDYDVNDPNSGLVWAAGCHETDGTTALAFARMRYADPKGDIGRGERQRQVVGAVSQKAVDASLLVKPGDQVALIGAGLGAIEVDEKTGIVDLGKLALAFRAANGPDGITGTPPISNPDYRPGGVGSTVQLDPDLSPAFWADVRDGKLPPGVVGGLPQS